MVVAVFPQDISVFLSLPCAFEVYLYCWDFLEGYLSQGYAHLTDNRQVRGGWLPQTSAFEHFSVRPPTIGAFPNVFSSSDVLLLVIGA